MENETIEDESSFEILPYATDLSTRNLTHCEFMAHQTEPSNIALSINARRDGSFDSLHISNSVICKNVNEIMNLNDDKNTEEDIYLNSRSHFCAPKRLSNLSLESWNSFSSSRNKSSFDVEMSDRNHLVSPVTVGTSDGRQKDDPSQLNKENYLFCRTLVNLEHQDGAETSCYSVNFNKKLELKDVSESVTICRSVDCEENLARKDNSARLNICEWLRRSNILRNIIDKAKESAKILYSALEINGFEQSESYIPVTVIADSVEFSAIKSAFSETFDNKVTISRMHTTMKFPPILPVGFSSALNVAENKIQFVKEHLAHPENLIVSTSVFLFQSVPHSWQCATVLCLNDPKINVNLHNFSATTAVPNDLVSAAAQLTPLDNPHYDLGFSCTIEKVTENNFHLKDFQDCMSSRNKFGATRSAALALAGSYKKYVICLE